jgi:hypothetical protein
MTIIFPRRVEAAAKVGPRLEISPIELQSQLNNTHGLSSLLCDAKTWEPFAWKGNDLSAPLRALYAAEGRGLLSGTKNNFKPVAIADIAAEINSYLLSFGKSVVSEAAVLNNLRTAALFLSAAVGVSLMTDRQAMTVQLVNAAETAENIEKYFSQIKGKLDKLNCQVAHAEACGYDVSRVLTAEQVQGAKLLAPLS